MSRRANVPGILIISAIYWGALLYWKWDELFPRPKPEMLSWGEFFMDYSLMAPFYAILVSIPYVGFIIWGTSTDLSEQVKEIKFIGRALKPMIWVRFSLEPSSGDCTIPVWSDSSWSVSS